MAMMWRSSFNEMRGCLNEWMNMAMMWRSSLNEMGGCLNDWMSIWQ